MSSFDHIQEPPKSKSSRRKRTSQQSPLDIYLVEEYPLPPIPKNLKPLDKKWLSFSTVLRVLWILWEIVVGAWIFIALRYYSNLFPESPLNPIRHKESFEIFVICLVLTTAMTFIVCPIVVKQKQWIYICYGNLLIYGIFTIGWIVYVHQYKPFSCENMSNTFPMYVELQAGNPASGRVFMNKTAIYELTHEKRNRKYHTFISAEYLTFDSNLGRYVRQDIPWPSSTGVTSIWTSLKPTAGAVGTISGSCHGRHCLQGIFWTTPNLEFEWTYTNPLTRVKKRTRLSSNEGRWYFGTDHRALVSLFGNGMEVFRAQSSMTVCTGGNGDLETSLAPLGLMFIAENNFNGF
jgi:hypothetical protein